MQFFKFHEILHENITWEHTKNKFIEFNIFYFFKYIRVK